MKLIYVHGRNQQGKNAEALRQEWKQAQAEGFRRVALTWPEAIEPQLPFYGDELDKLVKQLNAPLAADVMARGGAESTVVSSESELRSELLQEIAQAQNITPMQITAQFAADVAARGGDAEAIQRGPGNWEWVHSILKLLDRTPIGSNVIDTFTRDVSVYLTNVNVRRRIDDIVRAAIPDEPCVVIAHSLGTIVAYNVLRQLRTASHIRLITVGSPLGIQAIKRHLDTLAMPVRVVHWYNAMDEKDVVALYPLDQTHFGIAPPIENKTTVDNPTGEHHGIEGYLWDPDVARVGYLGLTAS
jgi:hypothetical protein